MLSLPQRLLQELRSPKAPPKAPECTKAFPLLQAGLDQDREKQRPTSCCTGSVPQNQRLEHGWDYPDASEQLHPKGIQGIPKDIPREAHSSPTAAGEMPKLQDGQMEFPQTSSARPELRQ